MEKTLPRYLSQGPSSPQHPYLSHIAWAVPLPPRSPEGRVPPGSLCFQAQGPVQGQVVDPPPGTAALIVLTGDAILSVLGASLHL